VSDLIPYLHAACWSQIDPRKEDLHIHGPEGLEDRITRLLGLFGPETLVLEEQFAVHLHEIREESSRIGSWEFGFSELPPAGNHGLKFSHEGKTVALTGDSFFHEEELRFVRGVDLAVIDAGHISDEEIVDLAARTQAGTIVCSHLYRELNEIDLSAQAGKEGFRGKLVVGEDLMTFPL
jgi:ribonuclease BN (tRNA processing enzyme)